MSLRIVYGRAGSGKTNTCLEEMKQAMGEEGNHPLVLIVPEQFSLQAEKNLAKRIEGAGSGRADVLSFRRLAFRIFAEVGGITRKHLDPAGKSMLLFKIMDSLGKDLRVFSKAAVRKGFTQSLSDAITEFKRFDISPEKLEKAAQSMKDGFLLKDKLTDLAKIYAEFEKLLHMNYMDADDDLTLLAEKLGASTQFDGAEIWIDEFSGLTPQEYKIIGKLLHKAKHITVTLCTDEPFGRNGKAAPMVFSPAVKTAAKLRALARTEGVVMDPAEPAGAKAQMRNEGANQVVQCGESVQPDALPRFASSEELQHLERNFYRYPYQKYDRSRGDVTLATCANPYAEVEEAAAEILRLCRDEGYRFREIAVAMRNPDSYSSIIKTVFQRFGIPYFLDGRRSINGHPLIILILSALEIFIDSWSYESVFRYAKTGLTDLGREELDLLENYVLAHGIRGSAWTQQEDWQYPAESDIGRSEPTLRGAEELSRINAARRKLTGPLEAFRAKTKGGAPASDFCKALFELLCETGAERKNREQLLWFTSEGKLDRAEESRQVWNIIMGVFSQIAEVMGQEKPGAERFSEVLSAGFDAHKIGLIPPSLDQVLAGSVERARSHAVKALLILGVNEGVLPGGQGDGGLLTELDRENLGALGLELSGNAASRSMEERLMVYMALAAPSKYLYLSCPAADREGKALRPSRVLSEVRRILPKVNEKSTIALSEELCPPVPAAPVPVFDELAVQLRRFRDGEEVHGDWKQIYEWFSGREDWSERSELLLSGLDYTNQTRPLTPVNAARLFGKQIYSSISRMESYAACPFAYFVQYGLKARERRMHTFDPVDAGTFMHRIIDEFSRMLVRDGISWRTLEKEWCREKVSELVDSAVASSFGSVLSGSRRYQYLSEKLKKTVLKAIMLISIHIGHSSFEPSGYEVEFGEKGRYPAIAIDLPSGETIRLTGRIDRIDSMTNEDGTFLRIIDYKSGDKALRLGDVYFGLQLQLVTYLDAVLGMNADGSGDTDGSRDWEGAVAESAGTYGVERGHQPQPAGVLYFRLHDPLVRLSRESTEEQIEKAIMKQLRMKGLILADAKLVREMDNRIEGDSLIIPARINKDGSLGRATAATREQFDVLRGYVRKTLASIGSGIMEGNILISPYKKKSMTACIYCSYSAVCGFDTSMKDNRYRILPELKEDALWPLMRKKAGQKSDSAEKSDSAKKQGSADMFVDGEKGGLTDG